MTCWYMIISKSILSCHRPFYKKQHIFWHIICIYRWKLRISYLLENIYYRTLFLALRYYIGVGWVSNSVNLTFDLWPWPIVWTSLISLVIKISWYDDGNIVKNVWQPYRGKDGRTDRLIYSQSCVVAVINLKPASRDPAIKVSGQTSGRHADIYVMATSVHGYLTAIYSVYWSKTNARDYFLFTQCRMP